MAILTFLKYGFRRIRLTTTVYLIQLFLAVTIGLQVYQVIDASIGNSVSLEGLKIGNAHMVVNDLLNVHGASISPLIGQVRWLVLIYLIMAAFIHAGMWSAIINPDKHHFFWTGGARYFFRCLIQGVFYMAFFLVISGIIWLPFLGRFSYWMEYLPSEAPLLWGLVGLALLWSIISVFIFVASSFSKILLIRDNQSVKKSIYRGIRLSLVKSIKLLPFLFVVFCILVALYSLHSLVDDWQILSTTIGILILFIVQQLIVWSKIALRISTYSYLLGKTS